MFIFHGVVLLSDGKCTRDLLKPNRGITLVETLLVIAVIGLLTSIALPAVQSARSAARKAMCANRLRQLGIGLQMHNDTFSALPHNGGWDGEQTIEDTDGNPFTPSTLDKEFGDVYHFGAGDPRKTGANQPGSWLYAIMPFIEQENVHRLRKWDAHIAEFQCPERRNILPVEPVEDEYGDYEGGGWKWGKTDYAGNAHLIFGSRGSKFDLTTRFAHIRDGLSNTIMIGEKAWDPRVQGQASWYFDEPFMLGGSAGTVREGIDVIPDGRGIDYKTNWGSAHRTVVQFVLCDGSVIGLSFDTHFAVTSAMIYPRDGEVIDPEQVVR